MLPLFLLRKRQPGSRLNMILHAKHIFYLQATSVIAYCINQNSTLICGSQFEGLGSY